jgi:hypothetical protein
VLLLYTSELSSVQTSAAYELAAVALSGIRGNCQSQVSTHVHPGLLLVLPNQHCIFAERWTDVALVELALRESNVRSSRRAYEVVVLLPQYYGLSM